MADKHEKQNKDKKIDLDDFDNQKFADQPPLEDLKIEMEQEKNKRKSQDTSQSEKKLHHDND